MYVDINKFLWMVRIGGSTPEGADIKESDYYTPSGEFRYSLIIKWKLVIQIFSVDLGWSLG